MRGTDRGQKAGLRWFLLNIGPGSSGSGVVTISCCPKEFPAIGRFGVSHLCHTFFPIWRQLDETTCLRMQRRVAQAGRNELRLPEGRSGTALTSRNSSWFSVALSAFAHFGFEKSDYRNQPGASPVGQLSRPTGQQRGGTMLRGVCLRTSPSSNAHIAPMAKIHPRAPHVGSCAHACCSCGRIQITARTLSIPFRRRA